jgi:MarR family transcriptional regulator, organic hydroperoxide resistance regulator
MARTARRATRDANGDDAPALEVRPLGAVLEFMRSLWGVNHGLESRSSRMKAGLGISGPERMVVRIVGRYPGIAAGELARILRVHPSTITWSLKRLVKRGLIARTGDAADARRTLFTLTGKGAALDAVKQGTVEAAVRSALAATPDEDVKTTIAVLERLIRYLGE